MESQFFNIEGVDINFFRSNRARNLNITIKPFIGVRVSVPYHLSFNKAKEIISNISIHPTFTAHPTETRRPSIIKKQRVLLQIVDTIMKGNLSHTKRSRLENEAIRLCRLIMFTGDVRSHDISVKDEINNTLKSTINSLWYSVSELSYDLESKFLIQGNSASKSGIWFPM